MKPRYFHSGMTGAPAYVAGPRAMADVLYACLVTGFNLQAASSAVASGGVLTLNFPAAPGFALQTDVEVSGATVAEANGVHRVAVANTNQVGLVIAGLPDGPVGGTISVKVAPAGWSDGGLVPTSQTRAFYQGADGSKPRRWARVTQNTVGPRTRGYVSMTGVSDGTGQFPTEAQEGTNSAVRMLGTTFNSGPWYVVATSRWCYVGTASNTQFNFFGDLAYTRDPADALAFCVAGMKDNVSTTALYFVGNSDLAVVSTSGLRGAPNTSPVVGVYPQVHNLLVPYQLAYEDTLSTASTPSLRGVFPNSYTPSIRTLESSVGVYNDVAGVDGRVLVLASGLAVALDEDWGA